MSLRSGRVKSSSTPKKRRYTRKQMVKQSSDEPVHPLVLEESIEKPKEFDVTLDEYGRIVPKSNVNYYEDLDKEHGLKGCLTEEEEEVEEELEEKRKREKKFAFKPIDDRDHCFSSGNNKLFIISLMKEIIIEIIILFRRTNRHVY